MTLSGSDTIYGSKRLLGRTYVSGAPEQFQPHYRFKLVPDERGFVAAEVRGRTIELVDVAAKILQEIRRAAEEGLDEKLQRAVITVPAYFTENQRSLVREAGTRAGLEVLRIINEPTAAALAFGCYPSTPARLLVFDFGGGTFDISIIHAHDGDYEVLGVDGNSFLGGVDFDRRIGNWLCKRLKESNPGKDFDAVGLERIRRASQEAKHHLSTVTRTHVRIPGFQFADGTSVDFETTLTRPLLEKMTAKIVDGAFAVLDRALETAKIEPDQIDEILLVGGQTRMPVISERLLQKFGKPPSQRLHPDEVVALGAAIAAFAHDRKNAPVLRDVLPLAVGFAARGGRFVPVVARNTRVPCTMSATVQVAAGAKSLTLAVYQGESAKVSRNQYLGTLKISGWEPRATASRCDVLMAFDRECLLSARMVSQDLGIKQDVRLDTRQVPLDVMTGMAIEKVRANGPLRAVTANRGAPSPAPKKAPARPAAPRPAAAVAPAPVEEEKAGVIRKVTGWFRG